jgi:hypothetical protein
VQQHLQQLAGRDLLQRDAGPDPGDGAAVGADVDDRRGQRQATHDAAPAAGAQPGDQAVLDGTVLASVAYAYDFCYDAWPEDFRRAILSHASYTGVPRERLVEKTLFAVDELSGFVTAVALVKPSKSLAEVDARSVRKKLKDKAFARSVNREEVVQGPAELGVDFDEHCTFVIAAMSAISGELGL